MQNDQNIQALKALGSKVTILYVEDNDTLREQARIFLEKFFSSYLLAADGKEGLALFIEHRPDIVITDIKMPNMDGFEMIEAIRAINPDAIILVMTAYKEVPFLMRAIELEVFRYLVKPPSAHELASQLLVAVERLNARQKKMHFESAIQALFHGHNSLICLLEEGQITLANEHFLHFFGVATAQAFEEHYRTLAFVLQHQSGFLSCEDVSGCLNKILEARESVFNVKMSDTKGFAHHFVLSVHKKANDSNIILVFNDVTSLGLLPLFAMPKPQEGDVEIPTGSVQAFLEQILEGGGKIQFFNYFKGLPISNRALLNQIDASGISFKTTYQQLRAISLEGHTIVSSPLLPKELLFDTVLQSSLEEEEITFSPPRFVSTSAAMREHMRLQPDDNHQVTLLRENRKLPVVATINDVSVKAVCITATAWMKTLQEGDTVTIDMVFTLNHQPVIINGDAAIYRITETKNTHIVVLIFSLRKEAQKNLNNYLLKRQMELIREFKGRSNG
ncbi:MAG: hypothetical protein KU37_10015 [Sulfuricurvum sp. PC08-66]|nr:MAG: hypothetical protein KU37_10015 [Sulfuricurvum sp. PC08-66]